MPTAEGAGAQSIVTIGDKGRAQLGRFESEQMLMSIADTYKVKVTFAQASLIAEELLKHQPEAIRVFFNKFQSAISFKPTVATVLSPASLDKQLAIAAGNNQLDQYEVDATHEKEDVLRDLQVRQIRRQLPHCVGPSS